jgi:methionyl-tRNA formyltransferase
MGKQTEVVFLGVNDAGMRVYEWLCNREGVFVHSLLTNKEQLSVVEKAEPDYVISCGYRHIVPERILDVPQAGCLNLHPAYLPYNRGANPNVWSIVEGTPAGVTLHWMDSGIDTGDIVARREVETDFSHSGRDLYERLEDAQVSLFTDIWHQIEVGSVESTAQSEEEGTYHETSEFDELCRLDPDKTHTTRELLDRLRALTFPPYQNARIEIDGQEYHVEVDIREAKD